MIVGYLPFIQLSYLLSNIFLPFPKFGWYENNFILLSQNSVQLV